MELFLGNLFIYEPKSLVINVYYYYYLQFSDVPGTEGNFTKHLIFTKIESRRLVLLLPRVADQETEMQRASVTV